MAFKQQQKTDEMATISMKKGKAYSLKRETTVFEIQTKDMRNRSPGM